MVSLLLCAKGLQTHAGAKCRTTYVFKDVPVENVIVAEALTVEQNTEQRAEVNIIGVFVESQFTAVGKVSDKFRGISTTQILESS